MSQTTAPKLVSDAALAGMIADGNQGVGGKITGIAEEAIPFGAYVIHDAAGDSDDSVKLPAAATDITDGKLGRGVALMTHAMESSSGGTPAQYEDEAAVSVMRRGRVYVESVASVAVGDPVYVKHANGDEGRLFTNAVTADYALLAGAQWFKAAGAGLAILELHLP